MPVAFPLRISVIIPVYNGAKFIEAAVASALQFEEVREVILVDDAGPDNSLAICEAIAAREPRVRLFQHPGGVNLGPGASRNLGIRNSTSEWVAFLDADDTYLPNRFDGEKTVLEEHPDADGVYGAMAPYFHDQVGKEQYERNFRQLVTTVRKRVPPERLFDGLTGAIPDFGHFSLVTLTVRRGCLLAMDALMRPDLRLHQDQEFMIRLSYGAKLYPGSLDVPVAVRGVHAGNRRSRNDQKTRTRIELYAHLWAWSKEQRLPIAVQLRFKDVLMTYRVQAASEERNPSKAIALMLWHPRLLKRSDSVGRCIDACTAPGGKVNRVLHRASQRTFALLWKIRGGERPGQN